MHSGSVNAALLLSSYLGNEHDKIGHGIANSDFAGELGKLLPQNSATSDTVAAEKTEAKKADATQSAATSTDGTAVAAGALKKNSVGSVRKKSASQTPEQRLENVKTQTKTYKKVFITNPLALESALAELGYPAETIKACKSLQNQDGWISLKDLKDLISNKGMATETLGQGQISTARVQALLSSIVQKTEASGTNIGRTFEAVKSSIASVVQQESAGVFNIDEFRALLDGVLQQANNAEALKKSATASSGTSTEGASEIALQAAIAPKQGQTESLASNILPSFLSQNSDESGKGKKQDTSAKVSSDSAPQSTNITQDTPSLDKIVPGAETSAAVQSATAQKIVAAENSQAKAALSSGAISENSGQNVATDTFAEAPQEEPALKTEPSAAASQETGKGAGQVEKRQDLAALAQDFGATIVSVSNDKQASQTTEALPQSDSRDAPSVQGQNISALAKEAVKNADEGISTIQQQTRTNVSETAPGTDRIITQQSENTQEQPLPDYNANRSVGLASGLRDQAHAASASGQFSETLEAAKSGTDAKAADNRESAATAKTAAQGTLSTAGKDTGAAAASVISKLSSGDSGASGAQSGESGSAGQGRQGPGGNATAQAAVVQGAQEGSVENEISVQSRELAGMAKTVEKQLKLGDSAPDSALFQSASQRAAEVRMEVPISQQSSGSNLNYNQPGDMAETIENWRAQYRGVGGQQLILELEPGQFGKVSIKVGANRDEVSAMVLTENESARQAILRNAPELRQSLDDQGLMLGKFQVDVNGEKAGSGNSYTGRQTPEGQTSDGRAERTGKTAGRPRPKPAYIRRGNGLSRVSIFA